MPGLSHVYPGGVDVTGGVGSAGQRADAAHLDDVVRRVLASVVRLPGCCRAGVALTEGGGRRLRFTAQERDADVELAWCLIDAYDDVPLTAVVSSGEPILGDLDTLDRRFSGMVEHQREQGVVALAVLPLPGTGSPVGGLILFYDQAQPFDTEQREGLLRVAADVAAELVDARAGAVRREQVLADEPVEERALVGDVVVDADPRAASAARRFLRSQLASWSVDDDVTDTAVLLLSELVTNAIIHTDAAAEVRVVLDEGELTVTVRDQGRPGDDAAAEPDEDDDPLRVHGRGLQLVDALAERWGSERDAVGTTVWFALPA